MTPRGAPVVVPASVLDAYAAVSLYNSPYPAHDEGRAIDLYPGERRGATARSPVAGEVLEVRTVRTPSRPYAAEHDHLVVVDTGERLARILHVDPVVAVGDRIAVGDVLGTTVRSGYFAPWVADHLHLGFRPPDGDALRAGGSLRVELGADVVPVDWDGTGTVVERGETYARLDAPAHPAPGESLAGVAVDSVPGEDPSAGRRALDGGFPHYDGGGLLGSANPDDGAVSDERPVSLLGTCVGTSRGRHVAWDDVDVVANGRAVHGLSLSLGREDCPVTLVDPRGVSLSEGERVRVRLEASE